MHFPVSFAVRNGQNFEACCWCSVAQSRDSLWPPWTAVCQGSLSLTIFQSLPKFMFIALGMLSSHLILWPPLLLLPSIFPSFRDFSNESSVHIRWMWILEFQLWHQSFQWIFRADLPEDWLVWSPCCPRDFQEFSPAPQFEGIIAESTQSCQASCFFVFIYITSPITNLEQKLYKSLGLIYC